MEGVEVDAVSRPRFVPGAVDEHAPPRQPPLCGGCLLDTTLHMVDMSQAQRVHLSGAHIKRAQKTSVAWVQVDSTLQASGIDSAASEWCVTGREPGTTGP